MGERGRRLIGMDKRSLSERDICTKFITPALRTAGWDEMLQIREEVSFTKGRIIVRGKARWTLGWRRRSRACSVRSPVDFGGISLPSLRPCWNRGRTGRPRGRSIASRP